jgi:hypothetical protein
LAQLSRGRDGASRRSPAARPRLRTGTRVVGLAVALALAAGGLTFVIRNGTSTPVSLDASSRSVPLLGSSVLSGQDLRRSTGRFGRLPIVRVYFPGLPSPHAWSRGVAGANRSAVIVSFKARPKAILSGADDRRLRAFFRAAPRGRAIYYSYFHEPEDNIAKGQFTAAAYKRAWHRVVRLARSAHNRYLHATLILMEWDLNKYSHRHWRTYLPGGHIISVLGWDAYPDGSATNVHPKPTVPRRFMGPAIRASRSVGLPFGFAEFGLSTRKGRPGWMARVGSYLMHSGALFCCLFDGNRQYPTLRLTDKRSVRVWRGFVGRSRNLVRKGRAG